MIMVVETAEADTVMTGHYRRSPLADHVQGTGDLYSTQCQFRRRRHLLANEHQKQCMETRSCEDRDVSELCRFAEKAVVTRMSCQTAEHFRCPGLPHSSRVSLVKMDVEVGVQ